MSASSNRLAVYTTVYPGVQPFLAGWLRSLARQTDRNFDLWIAVDALEVEDVVQAMGTDPGPGTRWVRSPPGSTIAEVRSRAWAHLCPHADAVVLVDSDDLMHPSRVEAARRTVAYADFAACSLRLVNSDGKALGSNLPGASPPSADSILPRNNLFGLSNSVIRTELLRTLLPIPQAAEAVDWYLATQAWLLDARFHFDAQPRMDYRQHGNNLTQVRGPYSKRRVKEDATRAIAHFALVHDRTPPQARADRIAELREVRADVDTFYRRVILDPGALEQYVERLNRLVLEPLWWTCVAHPALRDMWH